MEQAKNDDGSSAESGFPPSNTADGNSSTAMPTSATSLGTPNPALDENSSKSWTPMKNNSNNSAGSAIKDKRHFKKSMIVEYEKIESQHNDDSQSSSSCASFGSPLLSKPLSQAISQAQSKLAATIPGFGTTTSNSAHQQDTLSNLCDASANLLSAPLINFNQHFSNLNSQISRLSNNGGIIPAENLPTREEESSTQASTKAVNVKKEKNSSEYDSSSKASISTKRKKEENQSESAKSSSKHKKAKSGESSHHHHHHGKEHHHHDKSDSKKSKSDKLSSPKTSKKNKEEKKTAYCICREQANKRFMIACDNCDEWYHGACVGVSESLSNKIKSFYCHICRNKKPSLSIKYKSKFRSLAELIEKNEKFDESSADSSSVKFYKESKARLKREAELLRDSKPQSKKSSDHVVKESSSSTDVKLESNISLDASSSSSTKYYGKTNIPSEDIANFFSAITILNQNPSQAASAVTATKENAMPKTTTSKSTVNQMDHDYLAPSTSQSSHSRPLQTSQGEAYPVRKQSRSSDEVHQDDEASLESFSSVSTSSTATSSGGTSSSSRTRSPSGSDSSQESTSSDQDDDDDDEETGDSSSEQDDGHDSASNSSSFKKSLKRPDQKANKASKTLKGQPKNKKGAAPKKTNLKGKKTKPVKRLNKQPTKTKKTVTFGSGGLKPSASALSVNSNSNIGDETTPQRNEPSQCQGPGCVNESKEESKYCSDECAMKMARNRLIHFLDSEKCDFESMLSPSNADKLNTDAIEKINVQMELLRKRLVDLEQKHADLDKIIERAKFSSINPNIEKDRAKSQDSNETEIFCATCGLLVSEKLALKHMEKCYNKIESLAFFGSFHKTHIESGKPLFCDYFNPQTKMYCKRLKTMCPEHEKEKKINENEVCGCPLPNPKNLLEDSKSDLCLAPKRSCSVHFKWEKLRRAQIDLEKLRTWLKLEELLEQKRLNEASLNQRRNLLSLMLYKTNLNNNTIKSTS